MTEPASTVLPPPVCDCGSRTHCEYGNSYTIGDLVGTRNSLDTRIPFLKFAIESANEWLSANPEEHIDRSAYVLVRLKSQTELFELRLEIERIDFHLKQLQCAHTSELP